MQQLDSRPRRTDLDVAVQLRSPHGSTTGLIKNIGTGGVFVATHILRPIGDRTELTFTFPDRADPISVEAEVRWARPGLVADEPDEPAGMGFRFVDPPTAVMIAIQAFLLSRERPAQDP